jgi:hypothetical protein
MASHPVIELDVPNVSGLFQAIYALDEQTDKSRSIVKTYRLLHINGLGEFSI